MAERLDAGAVGTPGSQDLTKLLELRSLLGSMETVVVAYSGGLDSSFLAWAAHQELGDRSLSVTAVSPSLAQADLERACEFAREFNLNHRLLETREMAVEEYRRNGEDRCYFCKRELFSRLAPLAAEAGARSVLYGAIPEDVGDHRPGARAAREFGVRAPLHEVGLGKQPIRRLSRHFRLPTWNLPSQACLASRIAYGTSVSGPRLRTVDRAEAFLKDLGFLQCRVRHHEKIARIEVPPPDFEALIQVRERVLAHLLSLGFTYVTLDLAGQRSGSMNEMLPLPVLGESNGRCGS